MKSKLLFDNTHVFNKDLYDYDTINYDKNHRSYAHIYSKDKYVRATFCIDHNELKDLQFLYDCRILPEKYLILDFITFRYVRHKSTFLDISKLNKEMKSCIYNCIVDKQYRDKDNIDLNKSTLKSSLSGVEYILFGLEENRLKINFSGPHSFMTLISAVKIPHSKESEHSIIKIIVDIMTDQLGRYDYDLSCNKPSYNKLAKKGYEPFNFFDQIMHGRRIFDEDDRFKICSEINYDWAKSYVELEVPELIDFNFFFKLAEKYFHQKHKIRLKIDGMKEAKLKEFKDCDDWIIEGKSGKDNEIIYFVAYDDMDNIIDPKKIATLFNLYKVGMEYIEKIANICKTYLGPDLKSVKNAFSYLDNFIENDKKEYSNAYIFKENEEKFFNINRFIDKSRKVLSNVVENILKQTRELYFNESKLELKNKESLGIDFLKKVHKVIKNVYRNIPDAMAKIKVIEYNSDDSMNISDAMNKIRDDDYHSDISCINRLFSCD